VPVELPPGLVLRQLLEEPVHVVLPRDHPAARRRAVRLAELCDDAWITSTPASSCHPFAVRACEAAGFRPRVAFRIDDYQAMQELVAAGVGVAFVPDMAATRHPEVVVRRVAFRPPRRRVHVATRRQEPRPEVAALVAALQAAAAGAGERSRRRGTVG
jgi:DNA-binding transcriptional LysR family regulator